MLGVPIEKQSWEVGELVPWYEYVSEEDIKNEVIYKEDGKNDSSDTDHDYDSDDTMAGPTAIKEFVGYMSTLDMRLRGGGKRGRASSSGHGNSDTQDRQTKCANSLKSFVAQVMAEGVSASVVGQLQGDFSKVAMKVDEEEEKPFTDLFFGRLSTKELKALLKAHASTKDTNAKMSKLSNILYKHRHKSIADAMNQLNMGTSALARATELGILAQFSDGENVDWSAFSDAITSELEERAKQSTARTTRSAGVGTEEDDDDDEPMDDAPMGGDGGKKPRGRPKKTNTIG